MSDDRPPLRRFLFWKGQHDWVNDLRGQAIWAALSEGSLGMLAVDVTQRWDVSIAYDLVFALCPERAPIIDRLIDWPGRLIVDVFFDLNHSDPGVTSAREHGLIRLLERADCITASPGANVDQLTAINPRVVLLPDYDEAEPDSSDHYFRALSLAIDTTNRAPVR